MDELKKSIWSDMHSSSCLKFSSLLITKALVACVSYSWQVSGVFSFSSGSSNLTRKQIYDINYV